VNIKSDIEIKLMMAELLKEVLAQHYECNRDACAWCERAREVISYYGLQ